VSAIDHYILEIERLKKAKRGTDPGWLEGLRDEAATRFATLGIPSTKHEEWTWTNVSPITKGAFSLASAPASGSGLEAKTLAVLALGDTDSHRIVLANGCVEPALSSMDELPHGVRIDSLAAVLRDDPKLLEPYLSSIGPRRESAFAALNTALLRDGAVIQIAPNLQLDKPIAIICVSSRNDGQSSPASYPRTLILAGKNSRAVVIETFVSRDGSAAFTDAVTEIALHRGAALDYIKVQNENRATYHVGSLNVHQSEATHFRSWLTSFGGQLTRNDTQILLAEPQAECKVAGLCVLSATQHLDNHIFLDHAEPDCRSQQHFKAIVDDQARAVFAGRVIVRPHAQKTVAEQSSKNLLLSERAEADTKPQLEIYADDVKCSHGASTGSLDEKALFYLRSRGIDLGLARGLLTKAFAYEVLDSIENAPLRSHVGSLLEAQLHVKLPEESR